MMADVIIVIVLLCVAAGIVRYLYRAKKRGAACIGCPCAGQCGGSCTGGQEK